MDDRDRSLLESAAASARIAISHLRSGGQGWREDLKTVDAVSRRIEEVGEALSRVSRGVRAATPSIAWGPGVGMRAHLAHDDINVDLDLEGMPGKTRPVVAYLADIQSRADDKQKIGVLDGKIPAAVADGARPTTV